MMQRLRRDLFSASGHWAGKKRDKGEISHKSSVRKFLIVSA